MNRFSQPVSRAWVLSGSLLTSLSLGAGPALAAETFYAPHAVHQGTSKANPTSPKPFPGAPSAGQIPDARSAQQQVLVQPTAFQRNGQAPTATYGNGGGSSVQQQLDELYRKEGREAPQMNLQQTPLSAPQQAGQSRQPNLQQNQRPMFSAGSNVVPPKSRSGILSRINPFKSKSSPATQLPSAPPPPPPGNQSGYAQQPNVPGQNQVNQQFNPMNGQLNNQVNQLNNRVNNQANQIGNHAQQFGNQARPFNNQGQPFNSQPEMSIQPGQRSNLAPPAAPPANNGDELNLPNLPGESPVETPIESPPTDFGPKAPRIRKSEPDLLKDVFSDEPEITLPQKPQRPTVDTLIDNVLTDEPPLQYPKQNDPTPVAPPQSREPAASEIDEPLVPQFRFKEEDTTLDRLPLPIDEVPIEPVTSESLLPSAEKPIPPDAEKPIPPDTEKPIPPDAEKPIPPDAEKPIPPTAAKRALTEVGDPQFDEKMKIIAERGELRGLKGFCPVSLRDERDLKNALPEFHSVYKGRTYYFHSADAKTLFDENPRQYAPAASGLDVVQRKSKVLKEGSLAFALWYKDRLYLFTSQKTLEQFVATPKEFVAID